MILENFYTIETQEVSNDKSVVSTTIVVNKNHDIFKGHFPDNPVMPGVCMMQIIKEITESHIDKKLFMEKCSNVKFMALINPKINFKLQLELNISEENDIIKVKNISKFEDTVALKLTTYYRKIS
ncbi:MAG: 3-hydroxyacyl-ACP dehydratase [Flavobacteriaceae bacterium]|nr:3-hydroxyacyl-ACP dehydratase [Flavobacteriaceae bacterium]